MSGKKRLLVKPDSKRLEKNTDKKPDKKQFSKFLLVGGLMAALSFSPKAGAEDTKWKECSCDQIDKKVECGNTVYSGYKIVYDKKNKKLTCYCISCSDAGGEAEKKEEDKEKKPEYDTDFEDYYYGDECYFYDEEEDLCYTYEEYCIEDGVDVCVYTDEDDCYFYDEEDGWCYTYDEWCIEDGFDVCKDAEQQSQSTLPEGPAKKPKVKITIDPDKKGLGQKWLELELKVLGMLDEKEIIKLGYDTSDISEIKKQSKQNLKEIVSAVVKGLEANGLDNPQTKSDAALVFTIIGKVLYEDIGIEYAEGDDEGILLSRSLIEKRLDCDLSSAVVIEIADLLGFPIKFVHEQSDKVGHVFVAWEFDDGDHLYFESTSTGSVMTSDEFYEEQEYVETDALSECEDYDGDDYCDVWDDAKLNMYKVHPDEKPEIILDIFERMDMIKTIMAELDTKIDGSLYDIFYFFDDPEYYRGTIKAGCEFYKKPDNDLSELKKMTNLVGSWDESAGIYLIMGNVYSKLGDKSSAKKSYQTASEKYKNLLLFEDNSPRLYVEYAETLEALGNKTEAYKYFKKADKLCKDKYNKGMDDPGIYYWWGVALEGLGKEGEATATYNLGIKLCKDRIEANETRFSVRDAYEVWYGIEVQKGNYKKAHKLNKKF